MAIINRKRVIRPSSRLATSSNYKVDTKNVSDCDILVVSIFHEAKSLEMEFHFKGKDVANRESIHFSVEEENGSVAVIWISINPFTTKNHFDHKVT